MVFECVYMGWLIICLVWDLCVVVMVVGCVGLCFLGDDDVVDFWYEILWRGFGS